MKKLGNYFLLTMGAFLFISAAAILRPVPIVKESNCIVKDGVVKGIYESGVKDVLFVLEGDKTRYYFNRGLENGLDLESLRENLIGQNIVVKYPKYWTPLDWDNSIRHISKVEHKSEVIFNECKEG